MNDQKSMTGSTADSPVMNAESGPSRPQTAGEEVMNLQFMPNVRPDVHHIRQWSAKLYDWLDEELMKQSENQPPRPPAAFRLKAIAQTWLETFQMDAVKAVTYFDNLLEESGYKLAFDKPTPTDGELACTVSFNVGGRQDVNYIKSESARTYDLLEDFLRRLGGFIDEKVKTLNQARYDGQSDEEKQANSKVENRVYIPTQEEIDMRRKYDHARGAVSDALHALRHFQMFAVKAVTR